MLLLLTLLVLSRRWDTVVIVLSCGSLSPLTLQLEQLVAGVGEHGALLMNHIL